jgi:glycyl-tRNA synthetase beta subunit
MIQTLFGSVEQEPTLLEKLKSGVQKTRDGLVTALEDALQGKKQIDADLLDELEFTLISADIGVRTTGEILAESLPKEIASLYWPKNMYWRKRGELFVRPVRWLVAMLDEQVIPLELFGISAGKTSRGHRIIGRESVAIAI